jgi:hypothetical protein
MDISPFVPWLLLTASFAAGLSGLLVLAHSHDDIGRQKDVSTRNRRIARVLFVLGLSMLGWAGLWVLGSYATHWVGSAEAVLHRYLVVGFAVIAGLGGFWRKQHNRNGRR